MSVVSKNSNGELVVDLHMNITAKEIFMYVLGLLVLIIGFFLKASFSDIDVIQKDIKEMPKTYVLKTDYNRTLDKLDTKLNTIQTDIKQLLQEKK